MSSYQDFADSASRLIIQRGEAQARGIANRGQILGNAIATLGDRIPKQIQEVMRVQAEKRRQAEIQGIFQKYGEQWGDAIPEIMAIDPALGSKLSEQQARIQKDALEIRKLNYEHKKALLDYSDKMLSRVNDDDSYAEWLLASRDAGLDVQGAPPKYNEAYITGKKRQLMSLADQLKTEEQKVFNLGAGGKLVDATGKVLAENPVERGTGTQPNPTEASLALAAAQGDKAAENALARLRGQRASTASADEPLVPIIGPDGKPVLVRRSAAEGKTPANSREQGRPVTSGDANKISEINQSIDQAKELESVVGKTGPGSAAGAMIPDAVTAMTGWGADSKSQLATIALVKQIIGKGLEGGVLRAEDERKYEKILPKIGDATAVTKSKIQQLQQILLNKREEQLSALEDAGYDTSRFRARAESAPTSTTTAKPTPKVGDTVTYNGKRYKVKAIKNGQAEVEAIP